MLEILDTQCNRIGIAGEYKDDKSDDMLYGKRSTTKATGDCNDSEVFMSD